MKLIIAILFILAVGVVAVYAGSAPHKLPLSSCTETVRPMLNRVYAVYRAPIEHVDVTEDGGIIRWYERPKYEEPKPRIVQRTKEEACCHVRVHQFPNMTGFRWPPRGTFNNFTSN